MVKDYINFKDLLSDYIFANTPVYLYMKFRSNQLVQNIISNFSVQDLAFEYNEVCKLKDIESLIVKYAILVGISFYDKSEKQLFISICKPDRDSWEALFFDKLNIQNPSIKNISSNPIILAKENFLIKPKLNSTSSEIHITEQQ